jgi:hypothetical protein
MNFVKPKQGEITDQRFAELITLMADPYYDREFFTNLIYCVDRGRGTRDLFEGFLKELSHQAEWSDDLDRALLQLLYAFQASSIVREGYQLLPLTQGMYTTALYRSAGAKPCSTGKLQSTEMRASTVQEFADLIRRETRAVESPELAWASFLFLMENRTTRAQTVSTLLSYAALNTDPLSFELLVRGVDVALACGFKANEWILRRPFERFWTHAQPLEVAAQGWRLSKSFEWSTDDEKDSPWQAQWNEELWMKIVTQSAESAWEQIQKMLQAGARLDQIFSLLTLFRGRAFFAMKPEQWTRTSASLLYADALQSAARWCPQNQMALLATSLAELVKMAQVVATQKPVRPTGESILERTSRTISKDRLILRLDDAVERGHRSEALELMSVIVADQGLSHSVSDRLVLISSKQDGWTYDQRTMAVTVALTRAYDQALRSGLSGEALSDAIYGLLQFLSDQREACLQLVAKTGTYGNALPLSQYDVSQGARIVDRFLFNQLRNAQRIKVWPSQN